MKKAKTDSKFSYEAEEFVWSQPGLNEEHHYLLPTVKKWLIEANAKTVLDLGCGNGAVTNALAKCGFKIIGMDNSISGIKTAKANYPEAQFFLGSLNETLPAEMHASFDAVIAVEVIEHLLLPRSLLHRAKEALVSDGVFILTTPYHGYLKNLALALSNKFDSHWHPLRDYGHVKFFSRATIINLLQEQQFRINHFKQVGRIPPMAKSMIVQSSLF